MSRSLTESPIEADLLAAMLAVSKRVILLPRATFETVGKSALADADAVMVAPQVSVGRHRLDFLLAWRTQLLCVECDGADYHDVSRDVDRDHALRGRGIATLRFSGKQIMRDASKCAYEALRRVSGIDFRDCGATWIGDAMAGVIRRAAGAS